MRFDIVTLFPEFFDSPLETGLLAKARQQGVLEVQRVNPRDFTTDAHRTVDDRPYGGGPGMVMLLDPLRKALASLGVPDAAPVTTPEDSPCVDEAPQRRVILLTPRGKPFTQNMARELAREARLTVICGRYEGVDARLGALIPIEELSVGDFVLNGGETAALCMLEAVGRLLPNFMGHEASGEEESFSHGLLEYPHYTRPEVVTDARGRSHAVPSALTSGDHGRIAAWRREQALLATWERRPDLLASATLREEDARFLRRAKRDAARPPRGRNLYIALTHHPVLNKLGEVTAVSLTNLDLHDISRVSRSYGLGGFFVVTPLEDQQRMAATLLDHWTTGAGGVVNPDRAEALSMATTVSSVEAALSCIRELTGRAPFVYATSARLDPFQTGPRRRRRSAAKRAQDPPTRPLAEASARLEREPVCVLLGTGWGLAPELIHAADAVLQPLRPLSDYNHLSVRSAAAVLVDRLLGDAD